MEEAESEFEQLKLLFEYTKFHIGVYITLTGAYVALMMSEYGKHFFAPNKEFAWFAVFMFMVAGLAGGTIASSCPHYAGLNKLMKTRIAPYTEGWGFTGRMWTYIEHTAFWIGIILAVLSFLLAHRIREC